MKSKRQGRNLTRGDEGGREVQAALVGALDHGVSGACGSCEGGAGGLGSMGEGIVAHFP